MLDSVNAPAVKLTSDPFYILPNDSWKVSDFFNKINSLRMKSHYHRPSLKTLEVKHSLGHPTPHDFSIWNLNAELALAAFCLSRLLNMLLFWSAFNLPCFLGCLLLYWGQMGVYCATRCITNCLTMSFLNLVSCFFSIKCCLLSLLCVSMSPKLSQLCGHA